MSQKIEQLEKQLQLLQQELQKLKETKIEPRFRSQIIIWDRDNDLEWLVGPDKDTTWYKANAWVKNLGDGWRMPTIEELKTLYRPGVGSRNIDPVFATTGWWVWSGEGDGSSARHFNFTTGHEYSSNHACPSSRSFSVRSRRRGYLAATT